MVAEPPIRSAMRILFCLVLWAQSFVAVGQNVWVEMLQASNEIGAESLNPPQTAGANYSNEIVLESQEDSTYSIKSTFSLQRGSPRDRGS